jgi:hypothetical protein
VVSLGFIYLGLKILFGSFGIKLSSSNFGRVATETQVIFAKSDLSAGRGASIHREFTTVFGESRLDLTNIESSELAKGIEVTSVFGKIVLQTPSNLPLLVDSSSVFGKVEIRGEQFGSSIRSGVYKSPGFDSTQPYAKIEINSVFSDVVVR